MDVNAQNTSQLLIDTIDSDLRENIIRLDQKLKGLRAEVDAKLESPFMFDATVREEYVRKLSTISQEINLAIKGIDTLVHMVSPRDASSGLVLEGELQQFSDRIAENLEKITEIKTHF